MSSPPAKRTKLDTAEPALASVEAPAAPALAPAAPASAQTAFDIQLDSEAPGSLFGTLRLTLGKIAATEPQVGITQYVGTDIPPFTGIIKHRSVTGPTFSTRTSPPRMVQSLV